MALTKKLWDWDSVGMWHPKLQQAGLPCSHPCPEETMSHGNVSGAVQLLCRRQKQAMCCAYLDIIPSSRLLTLFYSQEKLFSVLKEDLMFVQEMFDAFKTPDIASRL